LDPTLGQITCFAGSYVPKGFLVCDGRVLRADDFPALGQWLSNRFGGDGASTFGLPNLPPVETLPWGATPGASTSGTPMNWIMAAEGTAPNSGSLGLVSEVRPFAQPPDPGGALAQSWLPCDGRLMNIDGSLLLYNLLGNQFGGKFPTTFALPDLPPMMASNGVGRPVPLQQYICIDGRYPATDCDAVNPSGTGAADQQQPNPLVAARQSLRRRGQQDLRSPQREGERRPDFVRHRLDRSFSAVAVVLSAAATLPTATSRADRPPCSRRRRQGNRRLQGTDRASTTGS
jgi:microcystin-dependent protein